MIWKRLKKVTPEQEKEFSERMEGVPFQDKGHHGGDGVLCDRDSLPAGGRRHESAGHVDSRNAISRSGCSRWGQPDF